MNTQSRCSNCHVLSSVACHGNCRLVGFGDPFAVYQAVDLSEGPAGISRVWPGHPFAGLSPREPIAPPTPDTTPIAESLRSLHRIAACPHRSTDGCGCGGKAICAIGKGRDGKVTTPDCVACDEARKSKPRIKVGLWCPVLNYGGAESWQLSLVKSVDPEVIEWTGLAITGDICQHQQMIRAFEDFMPVTFGLDAANIVASKSDVIIEWAIGDAASLLHDIDPKPIVVAVSHSPVESDWARSIYAVGVGIDRWVAVSDLALAAVPVSFRADATVINNAVTESRLITKRSRQVMRESWGVPDDAKIVGYLGRLSEEKNSACMATILPHLPDDYHVVVIGYGWDNVEIDKAKSDPRFHAPGPDPDAGSVLAAFDVLVVPSDYESFGLTLAEGLWCRVPVISTEVGIAKLTPGLARLIPIRPTGEQIANAILADQADAEGTTRRVESAKAWSRDHLGSPRFGREWTEYIRSLVNVRI